MKIPLKTFMNLCMMKPIPILNQKKTGKIKKKTQPQQTNVVTNPYVIYEYSDDTVQVLRTDELFPPRRNPEVIDVIDIGPQPMDNECPDLINQDDCRVSINGDDEKSHNSCSDLPSLVHQQDDDSTAEFDSDDESNQSDLDEQAELHFERAHAAKVTFIDDNNMYVTLETGEDDEDYNVPTAPTVTTSVPMSNFIISDPHGIDLSTIQVGKSSSEDDIADMADDVKPPALSIDEKENLAPKVPLQADAKLPHETILEWLEKQNSGLADSFAQEFNISTNRATRIFRTPKPVHPNQSFKSRGSPNPAKVPSISRIARTFSEIQIFVPSRR